VSQRLWREKGKEASANPGEFLKILARTSHDRINQVAADTGTRARATLVALIVTKEKAHWIHSGDSRLYHYRDGERMSRTFDHSVVQILLERGKISEEEMGTHPDQGRLLQSLGGEEFEEPEYGNSEVVGDRDSFLLCTDGFWEHLSAAELAQVVSAPDGSIDSTIEKHAALAIKRAGKKADNLSIILVQGSSSIAKSRSAVIPGLAVGLGIVLVGLAWSVVRQKPQLPASEAAEGSKADGTVSGLQESAPNGNAVSQRERALETEGAAGAEMQIEKNPLNTGNIKSGGELVNKPDNLSQDTERVDSTDSKEKKKEDQAAEKETLKERNEEGSEKLDSVNKEKEGEKKSQSKTDETREDG